MKYRVQAYSQFKRDIKTAKKRHYDMSLIKTVIDDLAAGKKLN